MLSRSSIGAAGALGGATMVCAAVLVFGPPGSALGALDALQARLIAIRPAAPSPRTSPASAPAFTLFGQGVAPTLRLDGVAISPGRRAALISIGGASADWLDIGAIRNGVTLVDVQAGEAVVDTDAGSRTLKLGDGAPPAAEPSKEAREPAGAPRLFPPPVLGPQAPGSAALPRAPAPLAQGGAVPPQQRSTASYPQPLLPGAAPATASFAPAAGRRPG